MRLFGLVAAISMVFIASVSSAKSQVCLKGSYKITTLSTLYVDGSLEQVSAIPGDEFIVENCEPLESSSGKTMVKGKYIDALGSETKGYIHLEYLKSSSN